MDKRSDVDRAARELGGLLLFILVCFLALIVAQAAHAAGYASAQGGGGQVCANGNCTPLDLCDEIRNAWNPGNGYAKSAKCVLNSRNGQNYGSYLIVAAQRKFVGNPCVSGCCLTNSCPLQDKSPDVIYANPENSSGGNSCWNGAWSAGSSNPPVTHGCGTCEAPKIMVDGECVAPSCPQGYEYDPSVNECRTTCATDEVYRYSTEQCVQQCKTGWWVAGFATEFNEGGTWYGNRDLTGTTAIMNGCEVETESQCTPSAETDGRGLSCMHFWKYTGQMEEELAWQIQHPLIIGLQTPPTSSAEVEGQTTTLNPYLGNLEPITYGSRGFKCVDGTLYEYVIAGGQLHDSRNLGACYEIGDDPQNQFENSGLGAAINANTNAVTASAQIVQQVSDKQDLAKQNTDGIMAMLTDLAEAVADLPAEIGQSEPGDPGEFDGPSTEAGYQQQQTGGLEGALEGADQVEGSAFEQFLQSGDLDLGGAAPTCISFTGNMPFVGPVTLTPYCPVWDALATIMMIMAAFSAWFIVFRV